MGEKPLVSVVTPVYNGEKFLAECIESILGQSYSNLEYIIVNNCSTDETLRIAQAYAARDQRLQVHNNKTFVGVIENHNIGVNLISPGSGYCKVVPADDVLFPRCIEEMVERGEANPSVGIVGSYSLAGRQVMWEGLEYEKKTVAGKEICRATLLGGPYVFGSPTSLLYRATLIRKSKTFFPGTSPHADTSACFQWLEDSDFGFVHQVLSYTRIHADSETSKSLNRGTLQLSLMGDFVRFGAKYLTPEELKKRLAKARDIYYGALVRGLIEHRGSQEFLEVHRKGLKEIGLEINWARLLKAGVGLGVRALTNPQVVLRRANRVMKNRGRPEAQYYC